MTSIFAAALLLTVGCGFLGRRVQLEEFEYGELTHGTELTTFIDPQGFAGQIVFLGEFNTPDPCFRTSARLAHSGSQLTLRLRSERTRTGCEEILGAFRYAGAIRGLDPGTYQIRVIHEYPATTWQNIEVTGSVTVR